MVSILPLLSSLLPRLPVAVALIVGIAFSIKNWSRHPRVSLYAVIGFSAILAMLVVSLVTTVLLPLLLSRGDINTINFGYILSVLNCFTSLIDTAGWALIIMAVFTGRRAE